MVIQKLERCKNLPTGEWTNEPDKANWKDEKTGLDCMIIRNHSGALCGYVGVPLNSSLAGKDYNELDVSVHGGLTYGRQCQGEVCHIAEEEIFWFGFDCAHSSDLIPQMHKLYPEFALPQWQMQYRNFEYVKAEVKKLASQIKELL